MAKYNNLGDFLLDIASSIRSKDKTEAKIKAQQFSDRIRALQDGNCYVNSEIKPDGTQKVIIKDWDYVLAEALSSISETEVVEEILDGEGNK